MSHIFISYSRSDIAFAGKIVQALAENRLDTWIDWKSIPKGEDWEKEIYRGIEEADAFLFLISPDSVASVMCNKEIAHAVENGKRILPIVIRDANPDNIHPEISKRNWIFCRDGQDDYNKAIGETRETIHTDYEWLKFHTELQVKALRWKQSQDGSFLLRGRELQTAEKLLGLAGKDKEPQPTDLHRLYVSESRVEEDKQLDRQLKQVKALAEEQQKRAEEKEISAKHSRNLSILMTAIAIIAVVFAAAAIWFGGRLGVSLISEQNARKNAEEAQAIAEKNLRFAQAREFALAAVDEIQNRQDSWGTLPIFLALESIAKTLDTDNILLPESDIALQKALGANSLRWLSVDLLEADRGGMPQNIVFSSDGLTFIIANNPSYLYRVDTSDGKIIDSYERYIPSWDFVSISPTGKYMSTYDEQDDTIRIWNTENKELFFEMKPNRNNLDAVYSASSFSSNENYFYYSIDGEMLHIVSLISGKEISSIGPIDLVNRIDVSPDNNFFVLSDTTNNSISVWDSARGEKILTIPHDQILWDLDFSPDSRQLAYTDLSDTRKIHFWNLETLQEEELIKSWLGAIYSIDFSSDGKFLALAGCANYDLGDPNYCQEAGISILDTPTYEEHRQIIFVSGSITAIAFTPDGNSITSAGCLETSDCFQIDARLFTLNTGGGELTKVYEGQESIYSIDLDLDETMLVSGGEDGLVRVWDAVSWKNAYTLEGHKSPVYAVAINPSGDVIASGDESGEIRFWDIHSRLPLQTISNDASIFSLKFSPDGSMLASVDGNGYAALWSVAGGVVINKVEVNSKPAFSDFRTDSIAFSPDGLAIAIASFDDYFLTDTYLWSFSPNNELHNVGNQNYLVDSKVISFSPDGKYIATGSCVPPLLQAVLCSRGRILVWGVDDPSRLIKTMEGGVGWITSITYSPDGKLLATGGEDGTIRIWDVETGEEIRRLWGHSADVRSIVFSNDGKRIISSSNDGSIRIWYVDIRDLLQLSRERYKDFKLTCQERIQFLHEDLECPDAPLYIR